VEIGPDEAHCEPVLRRIPRVIQAVQKHRGGDCWSKCAQPTNSSTPCFLDCLFSTMLGYKIAAPPLAPMSPTAIAAAFTGAFKSSDPAAGGCPDVEPLDGHVLPAAIDLPVWSCCCSGKWGRWDRLEMVNSRWRGGDGRRE
jgi:hypothetical protein